MQSVSNRSRKVLLLAVFTVTMAHAALAAGVERPGRIRHLPLIKRIIIWVNDWMSIPPG